MGKLTFQIILIVGLLPPKVAAQKNVPNLFNLQLTKSSGKPTATLVNINNLSMWIRADGWSGMDPRTGDSGVIFPRGTAGVILQDGIIWGGLVKDGKTPELRVGGQTYNSGTVEGRILSGGVAEDPNDPDVRIWRIRRDWQTADLTQDAAELNDIPLDQVTTGQIRADREQYERDWNDWPWEKGAPFYDHNGNGIMDADEEPGLAEADQVVWFVANDLDEDATRGLFGSPPIGLEMQVTLWAYKEREFYGTKILQNTIFKRYRLIYKGTASTPDTAHTDNMYIAQWSDPDVGDFTDDFVGCDSALSLGYAYNSTTLDQQFRALGLVPPAVGYVILPGPIVAGGPSQQAWLNFKKNAGLKSLHMSSFTYLVQGMCLLDPCYGYCLSLFYWNLLRGFIPCSDPENPQPYLTADTNEPTKFPLAGDPLSGRGDIEGIIASAGDRRILLSTGPFTMALGDTQEVIIALVAGLGADRLFSVQVMKHDAKWAHTLAKANFELTPEPETTAEESVPEFFRLAQNFPNPFNPGTTIRYDVPEQRHVRLIIYNMPGEKVKTLVDEVQQPGSYRITWDGSDSRGQPAPSGVYFYRFNAGIVSGTKKMLLLR